MKKLLFLLPMLFALVVFSGCSDDDEDIDMSLITGSWKVTHVDANGTYVPAEVAKLDAEAAFNDGKFSISLLEIETSGTYTVKGTTIICTTDYLGNEVEFAQCKVLAISKTEAELEILVASEAGATGYKFKCAKQK